MEKPKKGPSVFRDRGCPVIGNTHRYPLDLLGGGGVTRCIRIIVGHFFFMSRDGVLLR